MHKQFTEPIESRLAVHRAELLAHPFLRAARDGDLPETILHDFAYRQYADSILWIPMLAQMKERAEPSGRLRRAIEENIAHEAGLGCESHVALAVAMMRSLGARKVPEDLLTDSASLWLSDDFAEFGEPEIAGFLLVAETLVPLLFAGVAPAFDARGADTRYLHVHVEVDSSEHAAWMREATFEIAERHGESCVVDILRGMDDAWEETREVPDRLWERRCASR